MDSLVKKHLVYRLITVTSHPKIYSVLDMISHDSGAKAGHVAYRLPLGMDMILTNFELMEAEAALCELTDEDLRTYAIGESEEMKRIAHSNSLLAVLHVNLNAFFMSEDQCACCNRQKIVSVI